MDAGRDGECGERVGTRGRYQVRSEDAIGEGDKVRRKEVQLKRERVKRSNERNDGDARAACRDDESIR